MTFRNRTVNYLFLTVPSDTNNMPPDRKTVRMSYFTTKEMREAFKKPFTWKQVLADLYGENNAPIQNEKKKK